MEYSQLKMHSMVLRVLLWKKRNAQPEWV